MFQKFNFIHIWANVAEVHFKMDRWSSVTYGHLRWGGLWTPDASPRGSITILAARFSAHFSRPFSSHIRAIIIRRVDKSTFIELEIVLPNLQFFGGLFFIFATVAPSRLRCGAKSELQHISSKMRFHNSQFLLLLYRVFQRNRYISLIPQWQTMPGVMSTNCWLNHYRVMSLQKNSLDPFQAAPDVPWQSLKEILTEFISYSVVRTP